LVRPLVHEVHLGAVVVEELRLLHLGVHARELLPRPERLVHHGAGVEALQLRAHERAALARLDVLELDDPPHRAAVLDVHPVLELVRGDDLCHADGGLYLPPCARRPRATTGAPSRTGSAFLRRRRLRPRGSRSGRRPAPAGSRRPARSRARSPTRSRCSDELDALDWPAPARRRGNAWTAWRRRARRAALRPSSRAPPGRGRSSGW